jgi:histidine ammonia-lyase
VLKLVRGHVPMLEEDRIMAGELAKAAELVESGAVLEAAGETSFASLGSVR